MPKMKTHSGAKKRFRVTASGKIMRPHAYHQHNFRHKTKAQNRRLRKSAVVGPTDAGRLRRLLPYS